MPDVGQKGLSTMGRDEREGETRSKRRTREGVFDGLGEQWGHQKMKCDKTESVLCFKRVLVGSTGTNAHLASPPRVAAVGRECAQLHVPWRRDMPKCDQGKFRLSSPPLPLFFFFSNLSADCVEPSGARLTLLNKALVFLIKPSNSLSR